MTSTNILKTKLTNKIIWVMKKFPLSVSRQSLNQNQTKLRLCRHYWWQPTQRLLFRKNKMGAIHNTCLVITGTFKDTRKCLYQEWRFVMLKDRRWHRNLFLSQNCCWILPKCLRLYLQKFSLPNQIDSK